MIFKKIFSGVESTIRGISLLSSGAFVSQCLSFILLPIISRLYNEEDFGIFALFISLTSVVGLVSALRFDTAIPLPKNEKNAHALFLLSIILAFLFGILFFFLFIFFYDFEVLNISSLNENIYMMPFSIILMSVLLSLNYVLTRHQNFKILSIVRVIQTVGTGATQIIFGLLSTALSGLILGTVIGQTISIMYLWVYKANFVKSSFKLGIRHVLNVAKDYANFPKYSFPGSFFNSAATELPLIFIASNYSIALTGIYGMAHRILNVPISLISGAVHQVILSKIAIAENNASINIFEYILKLFILLFVISIIFFGIFFFYGPFIFTLILGDNWSESGIVASILIISISLKFCISPLSAVLSLKRNIRIQFLWQSIYLISLLSLALYSKTNSLSFYDFLYFLVAVDCIVYLILLILIFKFSNKRKN